MNQPSAAESTAIDPRFPASAVPAITGVRLSPGDVVQLVNISRSGVLVEGRTRFVPGTRVTVHFEGGFAPAQVKGKIVRCQVSSIDGGALRYQSGIQFESRLQNTFGDAAPPAPPPAASPSSSASVVSPRPVALSPAAAPKRAVNRW